MKRMAWLLVVAACGHDAPPPERSAALGGGIVARVGDETLPASLVADVARAQRVTPSAALDGLVADALAAQAARASGLADDPQVRWPIVSARARLVAERMRDDARARGPSTDEEIADLTARHWRDLDMPPRVRVVHALVQYPKKRTPEGDRAAHAVFEQLAAAVAGAPTPEEFEARARALPHDKSVQVTVERLSSFVDDGRYVEENGSVEAPFVAAAFTLDRPGAMARAETRFGWHVIYLAERFAPHKVPLDERRALLADEVLAFRARRVYESTLAELRTRYTVEISTAADVVMQSLSVAQP